MLYESDDLTIAKIKAAAQVVAALAPIRRDGMAAGYTEEGMETLDAALTLLRREFTEPSDATATK